MKSESDIFIAAGVLGSKSTKTKNRILAHSMDYDIYLSLKNKISFYILSDLAACAAPIGIFLGRIANFINGELVGRVTEKKIGIIFNHIDAFPRHPSQIYEAILEGLLLFLILFQKQ